MLIWLVLNNIKYCVNNCLMMRILKYRHFDFQYKRRYINKLCNPLSFLCIVPYCARL